MWRDLRPVLDEEIGRLPERHRVAVVLCYLEGQTNAEAARRLGCPRGTVATLLARARVRLRRRLTSRGLGLPAGLAALLVSQASGAIVPGVLRDSTVTAAAVFAADPTRAAGLVSARAASLAQGVTMATLTKAKIVTAILFLVGLAGAGRAIYCAAADEPAPAAAAPGAGGQPARAALPPARSNLYRTKNFVVDAPTRESAELIGRVAERRRVELAVNWLGRELPVWRKPCRITVKVGAGEVRGFSTFMFDKDGVADQSMQLEGPLEGLLADKVPHEVTHLVLAHWAGRPLPRWFDEGAAGLSESDSARTASEQLLRKILRDGGKIPLRRLLGLRDYPKEVEALHAQSPSLTDFLIKQGGRRKVLAFVKQGWGDAWDEALQAQYKYRSVEELEDAWIASLGKQRQPEPPPVASASPFHGVPPFAPSSKPAPKKLRGRLPSGPAPEQALVALDADGRLTISRTVTVFVPRTTMTSRGEAITSYAAVASTAAERYDLEDVRVYDTRGQEVTMKDLRGLLKGETLVLLAVDGRPVDPLHLRLTREGTLVFVLPIQPAAAPPPVAPAPAVPATVPQR